MKTTWVLTEDDKNKVAGRRPPPAASITDQEEFSSPGLGDISIKTEAGSDINNYPCDTLRGPRVGDRCSFPFRYPDCKLGKKMRLCDKDPGLVPVKYNSCTGVDSEGVWCYTKTYTNRSGIIGEWGYCDKRCNPQTLR